MMGVAMMNDLLMLELFHTKEQDLIHEAEHMRLLREALHHEPLVLPARVTHWERIKGMITSFSKQQSAGVAVTHFRPQTPIRHEECPLPKSQ
jgi:hypothetical protein